VSDLREAIRTVIYEYDTDKLPDVVLAVLALLDEKEVK